MPKVKTPSKAKLDALWSEAVKHNAGYRCEYCGKADGLNSHHIFSRSNRSTRWDIENGCCLCVAHHTFSSSFSPHKTPMLFSDWIRDMRGEIWYKQLKERAARIAKFKPRDLIVIWDELWAIKNLY